MWKTNKPRILFDLDDTLTDFLDALVSRYNNKYGTNFTKEHCYKWELNEIFENNILELINEESFFESVKPKSQVIEYMKKWLDSDKYDIFIVTSCLKPEHYLEKIRWIEKNIPFFPIGRVIPLTEKSAVWGDVLVDDRPKNLHEWRDNSKGMFKLCLLFDAPHNKECKEFMRIKDYIYLDAVFESYFN